MIIGTSGFGGQPISGSVKFEGNGVEVGSEPRSSCAASSPVSPVSCAFVPFTHSIVVKTTALSTWFFSSPNQEAARRRSLIHGPKVGGFATTSAVTRMLAASASATVPFAASIVVTRTSEVSSAP